MSHACQHGWQTCGQNIHCARVLDDWLGLTMSLIDCQQCGQYAVIYLVGWEGAQLEQRVYCVRELAPAAAKTYLDNIGREYCDLTRKQSETEALLQLLSSDGHLLELRMPDLVVRSLSSKLQDKVLPKVNNWQSIKPSAFNYWREVMNSNAPRASTPGR